MSRSYRKPWVTDGQNQRKGRGRTASKRIHNRKVRRKLKNPNYEIANGNAHKRGHGLDPWDICDWRWYVEKPVADKIRWWSWRGEPYIETLEEQMRDYRKACRK